MGTSARRSWPERYAVLAALLVTGAACGVLFAGCGDSGDSSTRTDASGAAASSNAVLPTQAPSAVAATGTIQDGTPATDSVVREGLPPDLSVSVGDTLVTPGQAVEFSVQGTADVVEVALSDGRDDPMPFVRDTGADTWRARYRVPLHPRHERFGVSVTAKNEVGRWRRAWVFLHVNADDSTKVEPH